MNVANFWVRRLLGSVDGVERRGW